ncbi:hypothetical protein JMUB5695_00048 [Mycobacterium heckeshornense]|uniref:nuclear transport factor 2 family protein n=1 Tax=Mycobacterium heckeshornense TaxID=110505 RepID=UPI0019418EB7|nr:nuclear transport factor 2 family protein [Mycobacterium heckeshornense]BCQ06639.1 hypothetical protein JMUB5695_00048 [Mycobacterium heckeshornense]
MAGKVITATAAVMVAAGLVTSCTTGGTPVAQHTTPARSPQVPSSPRPAVAEPAPTPPSDEDQIRAVLIAFQDAWNTQDWDAYTQLMCPSMREQFTGPVMDRVKKLRAKQGMARGSLRSMNIHGDTATATLDMQSEGLNPGTLTLPLTRSDGWKICVPPGGLVG